MRSEIRDNDSLLLRHRAYATQDASTRLRAARSDTDSQSIYNLSVKARKRQQSAVARLCILYIYGTL